MIIWIEVFEGCLMSIEQLAWTLQWKFSFIIFMTELKHFVDRFLKNINLIFNLICLSTAYFAFF